MAAAARKLAAELARCRLNATKQLIVGSQVREPGSLADAYAVQSALQEQLASAGQHVVGAKIGCTTEVMQAYLGIPHPCAGGIYDAGLTLAKLYSNNPPDVDCRRLRRLGLECELAVVLGKGLAWRGGAGDARAHDLVSVADAVGSAHAALEIVDDRYLDFEARRSGQMTWIADDFFHAGSVLGEALPVRPLEMQLLRGEMLVDGGSVGSGFGSDIINGHPLEALAWLAGSPVAERMGFVVSLGSVCRTHWPYDGDGDDGHDIDEDDELALTSDIASDAEQLQGQEGGGAEFRVSRRQAGINVRIEYTAPGGTLVGDLDLKINGGRRRQ